MLYVIFDKYNSILFQVKILGGQDIHVKEGSKVILKCVITNIVEKPPYVTWYLNNKVSCVKNPSRPALINNKNLLK